jgi:acetyl esterase/lipase
MMKQILCSIAIVFFALGSRAQQNPVKDIFPQGTVFHENIPYAGDTLKKHQLDIYLPAHAKAGMPLVVWVHGGAWMLNDKYADMGYMTRTVKEFIEKGYAFASIDYRHSTTAIFPAQIQDCNQALQWLYNNASRYGYNRDRIALVGFSAGGHLASLLGLSHNNKMKEFYADGRPPSFSVRAVVDFYGPADLIGMATDTMKNKPEEPMTLLLGAPVMDRPDLARKASPVTYVDRNDPPFLIIHGEKDLSVPQTQSRMLHSWLGLSGVPSKLIVVPDAPHYGVMFDAEPVRTAVFRFLEERLRN